MRTPERIMTICGSIAMIKDMIVNLERQIARDPGLRSTSFIADGEIVTFDDGVTSFAKLQARMQVKHPGRRVQRAASLSDHCQ
jgi:hypothetical protein